MFTDLKNLLEINDKELPGGLALLSDNGVDGQFLRYFYLSLFLEGDGSVCFLATANAFSAVSCIAQKLGLDLGRLASQGRFVFVDCYSHILDDVMGLQSPSGDGTQVHTSVVLQETSGESPLRPVFDAVKSVLNSKPNEKWCVLVEDANRFVNLGVPVACVLDLLSYTKALTEKFDSFLAVAVHADPVLDEELSNDDETCLMINTLLHSCNVHINVSALKSGLHKQVHGHLRIEWPSHGVARAKPAVERQFKALDRAVTIFARGTSSAVL